MNIFKRVWNWADRWIQDPAPLPSEIGTAQGIKKHRPIPIELGFMLHGDGTVYFRNRKNHTLVKCHNDDLIRLCYHEYNIVVEEARELREKTEKRKAKAVKAAARD